MIRGNTLLTLAVVLGLAYVFGKEAETEKGQEAESLLSDKERDLADVEPNLADVEPDLADVPVDEKKDEIKNDPIWRFRHRKRYGWSRRRRRRYKPLPTRKPTTTAPSCSASRPPTEGKWANDWQGSMHFECPRGNTIISIKSVFSDCQNDRIWEFGCGYNAASTTRGRCHWDHGYVNDPKKGIIFKCPNDGFIAGVKSEYFSGHGDRRFTFKCCNDREFEHVDCHHSHLLTGNFEYKVDRDKRFYITGINSYFVPGKRDREWKIDYCMLNHPGYPGSGEGYVSDPEESDVIAN